MVYFVFVGIAVMALCASVLLPDVIPSQEEIDR